MKRSFKLLLLGLFFSLSCCSFAGQADNDRMWVKLIQASGTAEFRINIPRDGCVSISCEVSGRQQKERIWGPRQMKKGTYRLKFPDRQIENRNGIVELFNINPVFVGAIGSRGNGERQFSNPMGLDFDPVRKELLIADTGNDRIIRLTQDGRFVGQHGAFGISFGDRSEEREDSLDYPFDVAVGGFSNFYVSDHNNERVSIFDSYQSYKGNLYPKTNDRRTRLSRPKGIKIDWENNIWVVESRADKVLKISPNGDKLFEIGGFGWSSQQLKNPSQVDIDINGEIYISDSGHGRIVVFDRLGTYLYEIKDGLKIPTGIAVDSTGMLIITDESTNEMGFFLPDGSRIFSISQANGVKFRRPSDIAVTEESFYLLDTGNNRVIIFERQKSLSSVAWQAASPVLQ